MQKQLSLALLSTEQWRGQGRARLSAISSIDVALAITASSNMATQTRLKSNALVEQRIQLDVHELSQSDGDGDGFV
jgi:hypothetical protein